MTPAEQRLLSAFDGHDVDEVRAALKDGAEVTGPIRGRQPIEWLTAEYTRSEPIMRLLLEHGADPAIRVPGLTWGKGYDWETTFFDLTPVAYCQLGLMPQVHRREADIIANIRRLLEAANRPVPPLANVPNRYLKPKGES